MRSTTKSVVLSLAMAAALLVATPATAQAAQYWASSASPAKVMNGTKHLGSAYGRGYNSTSHVNSNATYKRVSGERAIYVSANFLFWTTNAAGNYGWINKGAGTHNGTQSTSWVNNTRNYTLLSKSSQSRVQVRSCTEVPFLVPGYCTPTHLLTNSY